MLEVVQFHKKKDGGWRVNNVGFAQKNDKGGIDVILTSLPLPTGDGMAKIVVQQKQERGQKPDPYAPQEQQGNAQPDFAEDSEIPF